MTRVEPRPASSRNSAMNSENSLRDVGDPLLYFGRGQFLHAVAGLADDVMVVHVNAVSEGLFAIATEHVEQASIGERRQRAVDRREPHRFAGVPELAMKLLGRERLRPVLEPSRSWSPTGSSDRSCTTPRSPWAPATVLGDLPSNEVIVPAVAAGLAAVIAVTPVSRVRSDVSQGCCSPATRSTWGGVALTGQRRHRSEAG